MAFFFLCMAICSLLSPETRAQSLPLEKITAGRGLSQGMVHDIMQDHKGFLWICTKEGLNRFDGYDFRVFRHNPFDSLSLPDNRTFTIVEDKHHRLWLSTARGLCLFDPVREIFQDVPFANRSGERAAQATITGLTIDNHGGIWVSTHRNLYRLELRDTKYDLLKMEVLEVSWHEHDPLAYEGVVVSDGIIQFNDSIFLVSSLNRLQLLILDRESRNLRFSNDLSIFPESTQAILSTGDLTKLFQGRAGKIWLLNNHVVKQISPYADPHEIRDMQSLVPSWEIWPVWALTEDPYGTLAIATSPGLVVFDSLRTVRFYPQEDILHTYYYFGPMMFDAGGVLWIGTKGAGLLKSNLRATRFSESRIPGDQVFAWPGPSIRAVLQTSQGDILVSLGTELLLIDPTTGKTDTLDVVRSSGLALYEDRDGVLWAAGLQLQEFTYDSTTGWLRKDVYPLPKSNWPNGISILESSDKTLWILTTENLCSFDRSHRTFTCFDLPVEAIISVDVPEYPRLAEDPDGVLWLATPGGLLSFDPGPGTFNVYQNDPANPESLVSDIVRSVLPDPVDPGRYMWVGTAGGGLSRLETSTGRCQHFNENHGLPDMTVYGILADTENNLWMSTNHGLAVMDPYSETFKVFNREDGLLDDEFNAGAFSQSDDGVMLFGGIRGVNKFRPEKVIVTNPHVPEIAFTGLKISNVALDVGSDAFPYPKSITYAEVIHIPPRFKTFSIEFSALDFSALERNQYMYRMDGFDDTWQYAGNTHSATYTNLDPGAYTFSVRASNNDGIWNEEGASLRIVVLPPWYRTWWAYILYILAIGSLLYFLRNKELKEQRLKHRLAIEHVEAEKLKEVDSLKSRFFANISHEFRTPLTLILGYLENAQNRIADNTVRKGLNIAARNGKRLLQMVNQLLDLSKIDAGKLQLHRKRRDVIPVLKNTLFAFESMAAQRDISLEFESGEEHIEFAFDADKLERVFINLISNAIKFTPDGGEVRMQVGRISPAAHRNGGVDEMCVAVSDTGPGIPPDELQNIFDRFYQSDTPDERHRGGTGIGLALVRELVALHDGEVSAHNNDERGASFVVTLPLIQQETESAQAPGSREEDLITAIEAASAMEADATLPVNASDSADKWHVLIVEDNVEVRAFIQDLLHQEGYYVSGACNGEAGLSAATDIIPDLILTDVMMPVMDGIAMSQKIRADIRTSHIPIIMLTARAGEESRIEGLQTGVDDYMTKPVSSKELLARISNLIAQRARLREKFANIEIVHPSEITSVPMDQAFLEDVFRLIRDNLGESTFGVEVLADRLHMSVKNLTRKLNALIGRSPGQMIREARLQRAADLLAKQVATVTDVAYDVGYTAPENFSRSFKKHFGVTPTEYARGGRGDIS